MSHVLSFILAPGSGVLDLRRVGATAPGALTAPWYKACKISITAVKTGGAAATFIVCPAVVADDAAAPATATLAVSTLGNANGTALLDSAANPTLSIGQTYSKGYAQDVFASITATHLMFTCTAAGGIQIVVD